MPNKLTGIAAMNLLRVGEDAAPYNGFSLFDRNRAGVREKAKRERIVAD